MYKKFLQLIYGSAPVQAIIGISKRIILPGFDRLPLFDVANFFIRGLRKGALTMRASSLAFSFFLAIFPALIFFFTLIPYIPIENFRADVMSILGSLLPRHSYDTVRSTIEDVITHRRGGLLSIGFVAALYFSTNGINGIVQAFNNTYHTIDTRKVFKQRMISILLVLILSILLIVAIALISLGTFSVDFLVEKNILRDRFTYQLLVALKWVTITAMIFFGISFLYFLAPARKNKFSFISAGSTLATLLTLATTFGFNFYVSNFSRYNALYGSIGTLIIVLLWIYFNALILLIGFELNASIHSARRGFDLFSNE